MEELWYQATVWFFIVLVASFLSFRLAFLQLL